MDTEGGNGMNAQNSGMHDYRLDGITVDYEAGTALLFFKDPMGRDAELAVEGLLSVEMTREERWGKGTYVCYSNEADGENHTRVLEFELNSGDRIVVRYRETERRE